MDGVTLVRLDDGALDGVVDLRLLGTHESGAHCIDNDQREERDGEFDSMMGKRMLACRELNDCLLLAPTAPSARAAARP